MTRDEFSSLPLRTALGIVFDVLRARLEPMSAPEVPKPPKFDGRFSREGGFIWVSEMHPDDLKFWHRKRTEGAAVEGKWQEKNKRQAAMFAAWVEWRRYYPGGRWSGTRDKAQVTAEPPTRNPKVHPWPDKPAAGAGNGVEPPTERKKWDDF